MPDRRSFVSGLLAAGLCPAPSWADAGDPAYLAAAQVAGDSFVLCGLDDGGGTLFQVPLPGRGHAAAAHPTRPQAVFFARRPGTFGLVLDCAAGSVAARLETPAGRHFFGHGAFSEDGRLLFTTENDIDRGRGVVGVWDAGRGYARIAEFDSGGIGPHEMVLMPDGATLLVANGGIDTRPETERVKLNIATMRPNLSYLSLTGELLEQVEPDPALHKNSLRHLAVAADGLVGIACQWQGDLVETPAIFATHRRGGPLAFHTGPSGLVREMQGYAGSIAISRAGSAFALTAPRGGFAVIFDRAGQLQDRIEEPDICGVAAAGGGFLFTSGRGHVLRAEGNAAAAGLRQRFAGQWDNHLIALG